MIKRLPPDAESASGGGFLLLEVTVSVAYNRNVSKFVQSGERKESYDAASGNRKD